MAKDAFEDDVSVCSDSDIDDALDSKKDDEYIKESFSSSWRPNAHGGHHSYSSVLQPLSNSYQNFTPQIRASPLEEWEGGLNIAMSNTVTTAIRSSVRGMAIGIELDMWMEIAGLQMTTVGLIMAKWVKAEGIMCPTPYLLKHHVLVMEFIGKDGWGAPRLKDANLSLDKLRKGYAEIIVAMRVLYQKCRLVHGDLSEYNILYYAGHLYIIDVSQAVDPDHPRALKFLIDDCIHVSDFFKRHGVGVMTIIELFVFIFDASIVDSAVANYLEEVQQKILDRGDVSIEDEIADRTFAKDYIAKKLVDVKIMSGEDILDLYYRMIPGLKDQPKQKLNTTEDSCVISDGEYDLLEGDAESQSCENEDNESDSEEISSSESDTDTIEHSQVIFDGESNLLKVNAESQSDEDEDNVSDSKEISSYESDQDTPLMKKAARKEARKENKKKVKEEKRQARKTKVPKAVKKRKLKKSKAPKTR
ncbi:serine/threonine-protein kinase RIO1-like protein [Trifolium pratense]|uniref:non-specific serine/threonine protein kinase n=1 Tax=Trifolium pratense TaxID=57577 RepID=A0A2K3PI79_TRIPR|nr:serine/threonine-protein kinase RIO1-like protein [Trifolium pratense]